MSLFIPKEILLEFEILCCNVQKKCILTFDFSIPNSGVRLEICPFVQRLDSKLFYCMHNFFHVWNEILEMNVFCN